MHDTSADAFTSPQSAEDRQTTRRTHDDSAQRKAPKRQIEPLTPDTKIIKDETDEGGPLVIESDDPELKREGDKLSDRANDR